MSTTPIPLAILVLPRVVPFDLGVALQVFNRPLGDLSRVRYRVTVCAERPGPVTMRDGLDIAVKRGLSTLRTAHTIVIPGSDNLSTPLAPAVRRALQRAHTRGARLVSICTGAFVLAEAGVLDGRRATTHWLDAPEFRRRFPAVSCDPNVLYVDDGQVLTSAGIAAGIDLCLHVVRTDYGAAVANVVARRMVVSPHRQGGQAQFITHTVANDDSRSLDSTRAWMLAHLREPLSVERMAAHARMSVRSFARHFRAESGTPPLKWLLVQRIELAQRLLEDTGMSISRIATRCGFGSVVTMRWHFRRERKVSPAAYRQAFRASH
ncbi:GlxA family transcriptional regulator [Gemmatimonas sp.]